MLKGDMRRLTRRSLTVGVFLWTVVLATVAAGKAPFGIVEMLFLFAPLIVVPLGLELGSIVAPARWKWGLNLAVVLQPPAAIAAIASFWLKPGPSAGILVVPWLVVCLLVALAGLSSGLDLKTLGAIAINVSRIDLAVAAVWLILSRLGIQPMGFREPIILLTAVHFHYTGFATALIAGAMVDFAQVRGRHSATRSGLVVLVVALPFVLAAGFVFSPAIKVCAAVLLSMTMLGLAISQLEAGRAAPRSDASIFLWISSAAVALAMTLAGTYAVGDFLGRNWISIPRMASTHGLLNALGFALPALIGWLVAWLGKGSAQRLPTTKFEKAAAVWFLQD